MKSVKMVFRLDGCSDSLAHVRMTVQKIKDLRKKSDLTTFLDCNKKAEII